MTHDLTQHWAVQTPLTDEVRSGLKERLFARCADESAAVPAWSLAYDVEVVLTPTVDGFTITATRLVGDDELPATKWSWVDTQIRSALLTVAGIVL